MYRLREFLSRFLYGRNGFDSLNKFIFAVYCVLIFINFFFRNIFVYAVIWAVFFLIIFRMLSKNIYKRQAENSRFLRITGGIRQKFNYIQKVTNDRAHVYKKCPYCKAIIKLPRKKGKHAVDCPKCGKEFKVKI